MTGPDTDTAGDVPEQVRTVLDDCSDRELRAVVEYAQRRLGAKPSLTDAIKAREGEELVRTEDHDGYTIVVVERPAETGADSGPFAYRVQYEPDVDGASAGKYRWHYLGAVRGDGD
ncbi:hypothetical protein [Halobacterium jilantaiense]|uniref:Uncharacterized protein n=1 Tax=Halobacterium jilantaiense TaxID=355548 RepID=A0A1I0PFB3_9EURY|nr:hypothetical protein [Halobacterium jilantaiense]SEW13135.1 hypothetical protein SAMN04487945_1652 [Halobacterium jilantaiense]